MTFDSVLKLVAIALALYALLPQSKRLEFKLRLSWYHVLSMLAIGVVVHILLFYSSLVSCEVVPQFPSDQFKMKPQEVAYLVVISSSLLFWVWFHFSPIPRRKVKDLSLLIQQLLAESRYGEAALLLDENLHRIHRISLLDFRMDRLRSRLVRDVRFPPLEKPEIVRLLEAGGNDDSLESVVRSRKGLSRLIRVPLHRLEQFVGQLLPSHELSKRAAEDVSRVTLLNQELLDYISKSKPYFLLKVLETDPIEKERFVNGVMARLLRSPRSVLSFELEQSQDISTEHRYAIRESNRLVYYFFSDVTRTEKLGVWKPVGDEMLRHLKRPGRGGAADDEYNHALGDFSDMGRWESPLFVGIRFFDIMVSEAIYQKVEWHMWLMYFQFVLKGICQNYAPHPDSKDSYWETPTKYSYLIYEILDVLQQWILCVRHVPKDQKNMSISSDRLDHENSSIVKTSIMVLGEGLMTIFETQSIPKDFFAKRVQGVCHTYFELVRSGRISPFGELLLKSIMRGGYQHNSPSEGYQAELIKAFIDNDNEPQRHQDVEVGLAFLVNEFVSGFGEVCLKNRLRCECTPKSITLISESRGRRYSVTR